MKTGKILLFLLCITFIISCGEDRRPEYAERVAQSRWIKETMDENYYWYNDIDSSKLNYHQNAETFFKSLFSSKEKSFSTIVSKSEISIADKPTYGFEYYDDTHPQKSNARIARVLYTLPDSPAASILQRGDWIIGINDTTLNNNNLDSLYHGRKEIKLHIGTLSEDGKEVTEKETRILPAGTIVEENPIYYSDVIEHDGKKIAYLVYNSFTSGKSSSDETYLNELSALSKEFKNEGVEEFILDLRYNLGGELDKPVPMICTMLAPANAMGELMGYTQFNDKNGAKREDFIFEEKHLRGGSNLNLNRVFVLTNSKFTASASEATINFLKQHMQEVIIVGTGTAGKNIGVKAFENDLYEWILYPVVCEIRNSEKPDEGFNPNFTPSAFLPTDDLYKKDELEKGIKMLPLGDKEELLLRTALTIIDGTIPPPDPEEETRSFITSKAKTYKSSLDRKALPGVIIR